MPAIMKKTIDVHFIRIMKLICIIFQKCQINEDRKSKMRKALYSRYDLLAARYLSLSRNSLITRGSLKNPEIKLHCWFAEEEKQVGSSVAQGGDGLTPSLYMCVCTRKTEMTQLANDARISCALRPRLQFTARVALRPALNYILNVFIKLLYVQTIKALITVIRRARERERATASRGLVAYYYSRYAVAPRNCYTAINIPHRSDESAFSTVMARLRSKRSN